MVFQMPPFSNTRLKYIDKFYRTYERPRLNERFIYLVYSASHVGLVQGILHIYRDRGRLEFPDVNVSCLL